MPAQYKPDNIVVVAQEMVEATVMLQGAEPLFPDDVPVHLYTCRVLAIRDDNTYELLPVSWPAERWAGHLGGVKEHNILGLASGSDA
jgi:hypothetical protein